MNAMGTDRAQHALGSIGRAFYADSLTGFLAKSVESILRALATGNLTQDDVRISLCSSGLSR